MAAFLTIVIASLILGTCFFCYRIFVDIREIKSIKDLPKLKITNRVKERKVKEQENTVSYGEMDNHFSEMTCEFFEGDIKINPDPEPLYRKGGLQVITF
jgi:hypothetical protein